MTNETVNDTRLAIILADDNGNATMATPDVAVSLAAMLAASGRLAVDVKVAHEAEEMTAKDWGCNYLNLVKVHGHDGDTLAEQSRQAMGWKDLTGAVGGKIKTRFNTLRSKAGVLSGRWADLSDDQRNELLGGIKSVNTVKADLEKADNEAKRKAAAEKAAAEKAAADKAALDKAESDKLAAEAALEALKAEAEANVSVSMEAPDLILSLAAAVETMSIADFASIADDFSVLFAAYDKRHNEMIDLNAEKLAA